MTFIYERTDQNQPNGEWTKIDFYLPFFIQHSTSMLLHAHTLMAALVQIYRFLMTTFTARTHTHTHTVVPRFLMLTVWQTSGLHWCLRRSSHGTRFIKLILHCFNVSSFPMEAFPACCLYCGCSLSKAAALKYSNLCIWQCNSSDKGYERSLVTL